MKRAYILALAMSGGFLGGAVTILSCGKPLAPKSAAALEAVECRYALLQPYLGVLTQELIAITLSGDSRALPNALFNLGLTPADVQDLARQWHECAKPTMPLPVPTPAPDGGVPSVPTNVPLAPMIPA